MDHSRFYWMKLMEGDQICDMYQKKHSILFKLCFVIPIAKTVVNKFNYRNSLGERVTGYYINREGWLERVLLTVNGYHSSVFYEKDSHLPRHVAQEEVYYL